MADATESTVRLLSILGKALTKLSTDDVDRLLDGESKLVVVPLSWRPSSRRAAGAVAPPPVRVDSVRAELDKVGDRDAGTEYVKSLGLTVPQLHQLARELEIQTQTRLNKAQLIERIVNSAVGSRLSSDAIREGGW